MKYLWCSPYGASLLVLKGNTKEGYEFSSAYNHLSHKLAIQGNNVILLP